MEVKDSPMKRTASIRSASGFEQERLDLVVSFKAAEA